MTFTEAVRSGLMKYAVFTGRASRSAYWYFALFNLLVSVIAQAIDGGIGIMLVSPIVSLGLLLPAIGLGVRRLHDIGEPGRLMVAAIPIVGWIYLLYLFTKPSGGPNEYDVPAAM